MVEERDGRGWLPKFDRCILTRRTLKLILHDFSSNFILNMELSIHYYNALILEIECKFGYFIAT